ncbi:MAG: deoxyhypusine synthase [Candidatus Hydrothermarchaeaceae archaeon]
MKKVLQMQIKGGMSVDELIRVYKKSGVLGAGGVAQAADIIEEMIKKRATIFLGLSGPLVAAGLRSIITDSINSGYVNCVVTSGANVVHDMIESQNGSHYVGDFRADDRELTKKKIGRIGNIFTKESDFENFEDLMQNILGDISPDKGKNISIMELLWEIGSRTEDKKSFLRAAYKKNVPVFSPGLVDSVMGIQLFMFSQKNDFVLNATKDIKELVDMVFTAKKSGAIILGGGLPKHYILNANLLRKGIDYGVQITMDREEAGSLSGAKLEEGISWGKMKAKGRMASLVGDVTVLFPLLMAGIKERIE